jgi:hypothetical protein
MSGVFTNSDNPGGRVGDDDLLYALVAGVQS